MLGLQSPRIRVAPPSQLALVTGAPNLPRGGLEQITLSACPVISLYLMATRIVSWSGDEHIVSQNLSKTPSVISLDSILSDKPQVPPSDQGAPYVAESQLTHTASQVIGLNGIRTSTSTAIYPGTDAADHGATYDLADCHTMLCISQWRTTSFVTYNTSVLGAFLSPVGVCRHIGSFTLNLHP